MNLKKDINRFCKNRSHEKRITISCSKNEIDNE